MIIHVSKGHAEAVKAACHEHGVKVQGPYEKENYDQYVVTATIDKLMRMASRLGELSIFFTVSTPLSDAKGKSGTKVQNGVPASGQS